jgi:sulfatase modifying factor 1
VTGGTYSRTYDPLNDTADGGPTGESDPASVSSFRLDKYLVTVGRFRQFVTAWNGGAGYAPPAGAGKHTHLNGGHGLVSVGGDAGVTYETGWVPSDDGNVAPTDANLTTACNAGYATWTPSVGSQETLPINCVTWQEAYAFCIWDGGFLPSEAEWEYAAAGGSQQREYPWGSAAPGTGSQYAIYGGYYPSGSGVLQGVTNVAPVGAATLGAGLWGQLDLAGEEWEWTLDWYAPYVDPCSDCANLGAASYRVYRGGDFASVWSTSVVLPSSRFIGSPTPRSLSVGFRCARTP